MKQSNGTSDESDRAIIPSGSSQQVVSPVPASIASAMDRSDRLAEAIDAGHNAGGEFSEQLTRLRKFRDRMRTAGATAPPEQFAVRILEPVQRRSIVGTTRR